MSANNTSDPPASIRTWKPPSKPDEKPVARIRLKGWQDYQSNVAKQIRNFKRFGESESHPELARQRHNNDVAEIEIAAWEQALVYEDGLNDETRRILKQRIEGFQGKIESLPNTPASSAAGSTTSS